MQEAWQNFGTVGGKFFPIHLTGRPVRRDGEEPFGQPEVFAWGAERYALLQGEGLTSEGSFDGVHPCIASKPVGAGWLLYAGTNLGAGSSRGDQGLLMLLERCCSHAGLAPTLRVAPEFPSAVHVDLLCDHEGPRFIMLASRSDQDQTVWLEGQGRWQGLFSGARWELNGRTAVEIPARQVELFANLR